MYGKFCRAFRVILHSGTTMKQIVAEGDKRGLILGVHNNRIHVTPPCVISADEATQGVEILDQVLTAAGC